MNVVPWLLRIPGLRRYGNQIVHSRRQIERLREKISGLRTRLSDQRADFAVRTRGHKSRQPAPDVLRHVLSARHRALQANRDSREAAVRREEHFAARSAEYAAAIRNPSGASPLAVKSVVIEGLVWDVPDVASGGHLANRLINEGWLPFDDILATRELAVGVAMLDIGANIGTTSIPRVILGDFEYVYAAEPDPANYQCLVHNVAANRLRGFVLPDRIAIGAVDGHATLHRRAGIGTHHLVGAAQAPTDIEVSCWTLDSWVARLGVDIHALTFIKVDTQGWESQVLRGASSLLAQPHIAWQLEFSPRLLMRAGSSAAELIAQLEERFTHFIDLAGRTTPRSKPLSHMRDALAYVDRFTNILVYSARRQ